MKKSFWLMGIVMLAQQASHAQALNTVTNLRLWEHHSSSMNDSIPFGSGANGEKSGYDFVNRAYYNSFNTANFGAYMNGEEANIDMVEHKGVYGNAITAPKNFSFTAGVSSIWSGDIKGNGITKWMKAPASFNYTTVTDVSAIKAAFDSTVATLGIDSVEEGRIYLARIRNSDLYVAMKTYNIHNATAPGGIKDVYFDFDYKYGTYVATPPPTAIKEQQRNAALAFYPNPAGASMVIRNARNTSLKATIVSGSGATISSFTLNGQETRQLDISTWSTGVYYLNCISAEGVRESYPFSKK